MRRPPKDRSEKTRLEKAFGLTLRLLRTERGLSQEGLGFETGYHRTYIGLLERGLNSPSLGAIDRLSQALGIPASAMIGRVERAAQDQKPSS